MYFFIIIASICNLFSLSTAWSVDTCQMIQVKGQRHLSSKLLVSAAVFFMTVCCWLLGLLVIEQCQSCQLVKHTDQPDDCELFEVHCCCCRSLSTVTSCSDNHPAHTTHQTRVKNHQPTHALHDTRSCQTTPKTLTVTALFTRKALNRRHIPDKGPLTPPP